VSWQTRPAQPGRVPVLAQEAVQQRQVREQQVRLRPPEQERVQALAQVVRYSRRLPAKLQYIPAPKMLGEQGSECP
jgi:hypothetical protein